MKLRNKKTGEIITLDSNHDDDLADFGGKILVETKGKEFSYRTLTELNADWEDYTPAEPLIKDEKIRKAVRAWAEIHDIKKVYYCEYSWKKQIAWLEDGEDEDCMRGESASIDIPIIELGNKKFYTIAELCGEEEE